MFDSTLLFLSAATVTTTSASPASLDVGKTPADGAVVEIAVVGMAGSATGRTLDFTVEECDTTDGTFVTVSTFPQITTSGRWTRVVQSKRRYLRLPVTAGAGTGLTATVTAGIVSGNLRDQTA